MVQSHIWKITLADEDEIAIKAMKIGGHEQMRCMWKFFNESLMKKITPTHDIEKFRKKYTPISLSFNCRLSIKIITNRLSAKLDVYQTREQVGFRKTFGIKDHL